jgi:hypothetical protein
MKEPTREAVGTRTQLLSVEPLQLRSCLRCSFWYPSQKSDISQLSEGECRYGSPRFLPGAELAKPGRGFWPLTLGQDWCGQFRGRF